MRCPNCESENREGAKFCDECGFPLTGTIARVAASIPAISLDEEPADTVEESRSVDDALINANDEELSSADDVSFDEQPQIDLPEQDEASNTIDSVEPSAEEPSAEETAADEPIHEAANAEEPLQEEPIAPESLPEETLPEAQDVSTAQEPLNDSLGTRYVSDPQLTAQIPTTSRDAWPADMTMEMPRIESAEPESRDFLSSSAKKQKRNGVKIAFAVIAVIVVAAAIAGGTYFMGLWGGKVLPSVIGMTEADARAELEADGFTVRSTQVKSDETEGLVLVMDPAAGGRANEGSEVIIHVASARTIPDVVAKNADVAMKELKDAGYENVKRETQKSNGEENVVLSVSPDPGTRVKSASEVTIVVSEAYRVPNVSGMTANAAVEAVREAGLTPYVAYVDTDAYADGTLLGTIPETGTKMQEGDAVTVSVSRQRGAQLVALTQQLLAPGSSVTVGMYNYDIESLNSVNYVGDNTVAFTATGRPKITFFGETLYASSSQSIQGQVVWSDDNRVLSIS